MFWWRQNLKDRVGSADSRQLRGVDHGFPQFHGDTAGHPHRLPQVDQRPHSHVHRLRCQISIVDTWRRGWHWHLEAVLWFAELSHVVDDAAELQVLVAEGGDFLVVNSDASVARVWGDGVGDVGRAAAVGLSCELVGCQDNSGPALNQWQASVIHHGDGWLYHLQTEEFVERAMMTVGYVEIENTSWGLTLTEGRQEGNIKETKKKRNEMLTAIYTSLNCLNCNITQQW